MYFALAEGVRKALGADLAPRQAHGTAFGFYNAAPGVGALPASVVFWVLNERRGRGVAFTVGADPAALAAVLLMLLRTDKTQD